MPGSTAGDSDPSVGIGARRHGLLRLRRRRRQARCRHEHDEGATWKNQQVVGTAFGIQNAVFPAMVAGDATARPSPTSARRRWQLRAHDDFQGIWHLYIATPTTAALVDDQRATPNDPVQRGSIGTAGTTGGADRNLLDFIDVTRDDHGRVLVGYADGCIDVLRHGPNSEQRKGPLNSAYATIARQSTIRRR